MSNVIITGTSRGIGFELAQIFAKNNYQVLAISRNSDTLSRLNIKNITCLSIDLSVESELEKIVKFVSDNWNTVDILVNNAGKLINKPFENLSTVEFLEVYKVNVFAVAALTRLLIPKFIKGSHIVNISSIGGVQGSLKFPGLAAYSSSKGALLSLTELLAEEYKDKQFAFNALALGAVQTEMLEEAFPTYKAPVSALDMAEYIYDFAINGNKYYNGKILQVSSSTP